MTTTVEALDWDSAFFGFPIGRVDLDGADDEGLTSVEAQADALGLVCLYAGLDPVHLETTVLAQQHGFELVEVAMDLDHRTSIIAHRPPTSSTARVGTEADLPALADEIELIAPWSRFAVDPRFGPTAARRMHQAWVERALRGEDGRMLIVAEDDQGVTGFSTQTSLEADEPRIDLIASSKPRSGAAQSLVAYAFDLFGERLSWGGPIVARNITSLRFCENMGYRVATSRYLYHRWFDRT